MFDIYSVDGSGTLDNKRMRTHYIPFIMTLLTVTELERISHEDAINIYYDVDNKDEYITKKDFIRIYDSNTEVGELLQHLILKRLPFAVKHEILKRYIRKQFCLSVLLCFVPVALDRF